MRAEDFAKRSTEEVMNQPGALEGYNAFLSDKVLVEALRTFGAEWAHDELVEVGADCGSPETLRLGELANQYEPELHNYDRFGHRIDRVDYHAAYHALMERKLRSGLHASPWSSERKGRFVARAANYYLQHQVEQGSSCPVTMTFAVVPSIRMQPDVASRWLPMILQGAYDARDLPAEDKRGLIFGMAMTERQGGSDVRSNATKARPLKEGGPGQLYVIDGHKWFCSAPMSDGFLMLAQTESGLSCFLVPRYLEDGTRNAIRVERLKPKLGNRSNASSEIRIEKAHGYLVGDEGRGVATIIEMVRHTRLDCCIGAASLIRRCVAEALHHASNRFAFGKLLVEQPLMKNVLADLCLESEAATWLMMRINAAYEASEDDPTEAAFARLATAVAKFQLTRKETEVAREALECHGGNGFIEEGPMARLFRESPLNAIWEGSGNVQCLDVLRAARRQPQSMAALVKELRSVEGKNATYDEWLVTMLGALEDEDAVELRARRLVEELALGLQAAVLLRYSPEVVADAFILSRLGGGRGQAFGTLPSTLDFDFIISRHRPMIG